ncbi:Ankyrin repeat and protein kinase domain-containing protein 1 [Colletotrichum siamense]|uniref:Ankyrin repeat and protein kinase domain-containing protein 1 n=1 Tax=Colletotrichum siamense TaxID=690259 RepID=UPI0018728584|nr:Ankyrin repeat and protein kinase domain-containing protein 1 [Colletotrichum siamense]KAF5494149.1 Ankyrin repeat and protein kinase domain-containing protein 1 [Colletotrichum siamense]
MPTASKASPEIWLEIGYYVDSFHELAALARVNRMLYGIFQVDLYCKAVRQSCTEITVLAAAKGNLDTLKVAAAFGADLNRVYGIPPPIWNHDGSREPIRIPLDQCWATPLHLAVQHGHEEIVRWLVHVQKVKVNSPGRFLCPCMPAIVRLGMNYGGPRTSMGAWSSHPVWTPLHLAICQNHESIARELLENGGSHDTLIARENLPPFENGAWKVLSVPDGAYRPQMYARDHWKSVPNVKLPHIAALSGSEAIMTLVVRDLGGDVNAVDATAATPLHYAIIEKDEMMVRHLLSLGADPDCQQNHFQHSVPTGGMRWGALDFALRYDPRMASILLKHGASVWNPRLRSGPIESSLKSIICYHDVNAVPLDLRLFLRLTRQQERRRSLSTWAAFEFRLAEEEIQATFFRACQSIAFSTQDLEAFIDEGELELGSTPMNKALQLQLSLPPHKIKRVTTASKDWELVNFDTSKNSLASLALCLTIRVIRPHYNAYTTVRWLLDKGAAPTIELQGGVEISILAILLKQIDKSWVAHLNEPPINWEQNPLRDIARTIVLLRDRGAWSLRRNEHTAKNLKREFGYALDRLFPHDMRARSFSVHDALTRAVSQFEQDCGMYMA